MLSALIRNRIYVDVSFKEKAFPSGLLGSNGGMIFNESITSVYVDLDRLIEESPLSKRQRAVVQLLMRGYTIQDIADTTGNSQSNISHIFSRAVETLSEQHFKRWVDVVTGRAVKGNEDK